MLWNSELSWPVSSSASETYTSVTLYKHATIHLPTLLIIDIIDTSSSGILNNAATPLLSRLLLCVARGFLQDKLLEIKLLSRRAGIFKTLPSATNTPYQVLLLVVHESEGCPPPSPTPSSINLFTIYHSSIISVTAVGSPHGTEGTEDNLNVPYSSLRLKAEIRVGMRRVAEYSEGRIKHKRPSY